MQLYTCHLKDTKHVDFPYQKYTSCNASLPYPPRYHPSETETKSAVDSIMENSDSHQNEEEEEEDEKDEVQETRSVKVEEQQQPTWFNGHQEKAKT
jgi:hypothetical protein